MKRHKHQKICCLLLVLILLALSGCRAGQEGTNETSNNKKDPQGATTEVSGDTIGSDDVTTLGTATDPTVEEKSRLVGYEQFYDRSMTEGKLAAYFFCPASELITWQSTAYGGDCTLYILPDGTTALVDCGLQTDGASIVWKLQKLGIEKLDYFFLSHGHGDHVGGFRILSRYFDIGHIYLPPEESNQYYNVQGKTFWAIVEEKNIPYTYIKAGDTFTIGKDVNVKVYNPEPEILAKVKSEGMNLNETSVVMKLTWKNASYLMVGDIGNNPDYGRLTEEELVAQWGSELKADVCKAGHHGSDKLKGSNIWKETVGAKIYAFTTAYMRSEIEWFKYVKTGATVVSGALDGDVCIYTSGDGTYEIQVSHDRTSNYYGSLNTKDGHMQVK